MNYHHYQRYIDACLHCAAICNHCASSCLKEEDTAMMARCIQLDMECAIVCNAAAQLMSLGSELAPDAIKLAIDFCERCAEECEKHDNLHCEECAKACRNCAEKCTNLL